MPNKLINEKSPYLLQHAYNPVDWYPWGEEAFEKARREDKPVFLSIGYSTCHWCHVMERESFEDHEVAEVLNRVFVCIKVDREERPDIDGVYMAVCQAMTGSGGWPLTIFMTAEKRPFFAGTYFPKTGRFGRPGLIELARRVETLWKTARDDMEKNADSVLSALESMNSVSPGQIPGSEILDAAFMQLEKRFDEKHGGFGTAPKFPTPHNLTFLLRYWKRTGNGKALAMVEKTLQAISMGGICDHLGFGFHRYSTDREWLLPHFEKMLYDQALLSMAYLEVYQATEKEMYAATAREIFHYVLRDMTSPEGGFYSAEDADSEGVEGKFYVWSAGEIRSLLDSDDAALFEAVYNISDDGNYLDEATRQPTGLNIIHRTKPFGELAGILSMAESDLVKRIKDINGRLFLERKKRVHPHKDDKILTDWNGLMIAALAMGGRILAEEAYTDAAQKAAAFIAGHLKKDGRLLKRYRDGEASLPAHLDDYAFLTWGLIELYETTFKEHYLEEALDLNQAAISLFQDRQSGSFYFTAQEADTLPVRHRELYDGALPSGNSVAALNNLRLGKITGRAELADITEKIAAAFSGELAQVPSAYTQMLSALDFYLGPAAEVVIAGQPGADDTKLLLGTLRRAYLPNKVVVFNPAGNGEAITRLAPHVREKTGTGTKATAYVCRDFACREPVTEPEALLHQLNS